MSFMTSRSIETKMNQNNPSSLDTIVVITLLFLLAKTSLCEVDPKFEACVPKTCGDDQNISFPFWIEGRQEEFCGQPRFQIVCNKNGNPTINISRDNYTIKNISYEDQSIRVTAGYLDLIGNTCYPPITTNLIPLGSRFRIDPPYSQLYFYTDCISPLPNNLTSYKLNCSSENGTSPILAVLGADTDTDTDTRLKYVSRECRSTVATPVEVYKDEKIGGGWEEYNKVMRRGFVLNWIASNCSACTKSGGRCGFDSKTYLFRCFCPDGTRGWQCRPPRSGRSNSMVKKLALGIGLPVVFIIILLFFYIVRRRYKRKYGSPLFLSSNISSDPNSKSEQDRGCLYFGIPIFSYSELEEATNNFDPNKELGDGGFGTVYYGKLQDGREVAVKRLYESNYRRVEQFMNEVEILTRLRHKNLVSLYGCTSRHSRELLLVYEYVPNGTVADHLHGDQAKPSPLSWSVRMSIAIETASALAYLHSSDIIHRDVKTNNILLDDNFCVKVADFGLSRLFPTDVTHISTAPQGTPGYVDPEYHQCYQLTVKSDVYSFGVVLIELISSLPAVDISRHRHEINLSNLALNKIQNRAFHELVDPCLGFETNFTIRVMTTLVAELAFRCLQQDKEIRPSMEEVLEVLKGIQNENYEMEKTEESENNVGVLNSTRQSPPSDSDDVGLLKRNMPLPPSPVSVTDNWVSSSTIHSASSG